MGRWTQYDEDDYRLPEGMKRIGYDADTQSYSFRHRDGSIWESAHQYGRMKKVGQASPSPAYIADKARNDSMFAPPPSDQVFTTKRKGSKSAKQPRPQSLSTRRTRSQSPPASRPRSQSPSTGFRERFGYNPNPATESGKVTHGKTSSAKPTDSVAAEKREKADSQDRVVSATPVGSLIRGIDPMILPKSSVTPSTNFADIVPANKQENGVNRNRSVSSPMGFLRRAMTVVSKAAPKERPERGGTGFESLEKAKIMMIDEEESESEDEKKIETRPSRFGRTISVRRLVEHGPDGEKKGGLGRRGTVRW